jgi:hypothetical protein
MRNSFQLLLLCHVCDFGWNFSQEYSSNSTPMTSTTAQTHCDLSVINSMNNFSFYESNQVPILIQNSLSHWPKYSKWYQTFSQQRVQVLPLSYALLMSRHRFHQPIPLFSQMEKLNLKKSYLKSCNKWNRIEIFMSST